MKRSVFIAILLMGCVAVFAADYEMSFDGMRYVGTVEKTFSVSKGGSLDMKDIEGDVSIIGEARKDVEIVERFRINSYSEASARQIFANDRSRYLHKGNNVIVKGSAGSRRYECDFLVRVPVEFMVGVDVSGGDVDVESIQGDVSVETSGGDVEVLSVRGNTDVHTSGGDVTVEDGTGDLRAVTSGGDIIVERITGQVYIKTSGGDISASQVVGAGEIATSGGDIDLVDLQGDRFDVRTSGGDILISSVVGSIWAETSGGNVEVTKAYRRGSKHNDVDISSSGGDILVYLPDEMQADIYAEISIRDRWEDNEIRSDIPLEISRFEKGSRIFLVGEGDMNGGGDEVVLKTSDGDIKIVRILDK